MTARHAIWARLAAACLTATGLTGCAGEVERPNLILISLDTLRPDRLGCYGSERGTSPNLDRFAAEGVLFEDVSSAGPWTLPAHASMLTGVYPRRHGVKAFEHRLGEEHATLATRLAADGYRTLAVVNSVLLADMNGLDQGFDEHVYVSEFVDEPDGTRRIVSSAGELVARARGLLEGGGLERDDGRPFFLFLHFYDAHSDYAPDPRHRERLVRPYTGPVDGSTAQLVAIRQNGVQLGPEDARHLSELYDAEIHQLDERLGELFAFLDESGLADETLVVITSDHGEEFAEHGSVLHGRTYYEEVIRIPLILRGPGLPRGARVPQPVSLVDVAPTILARLGQPYARLDGIDLASHWRGDAPPAARVLFAEGDHGLARNDVRRMVRDGRYKLCVDEERGEARLFDLERDPEERNDLAAEQGERVQALLARLEAHQAASAADASGSAPSAATLEHLQELGYTSDGD